MATNAQFRIIRCSPYADKFCTDMGIYRRYVSKRLGIPDRSGFDINGEYSHNSLFVHAQYAMSLLIGQPYEFKFNLRNNGAPGEPFMRLKRILGKKPPEPHSFWEVYVRSGHAMQYSQQEIEEKNKKGEIVIKKKTILEERSIHDKLLWFQEYEVSGDKYSNAVYVFVVIINSLAIFCGWDFCRTAIKRGEYKPPSGDRGERWIVKPENLRPLTHLGELERLSWRSLDDAKFWQGHDKKTKEIILDPWKYQLIDSFHRHNFNKRFPLTRPAGEKEKLEAIKKEFIDGKKTHSYPTRSTKP